jgi:hypothetical protein
MRGKTLIPAALFGVAIAALALAQTTSTPSTAPANGETAAPAPPNTQPTAAKPPETSPEAAQGSRGGQGGTQATAPEPGSNPTTATSAPGGAPKEGATVPQPGRKPVTEPRRVTEHPKGARHASNVGRAPTRVSPAQSVDENASADQSLRDAHSALRRHNTQDALKALERAETRVLNSVPDGNVSQNSSVITIERAREALGHARYLRPDPGQAGQLIDEALAQTGTSSRPSASR